MIGKKINALVFYLPLETIFLLCEAGGLQQLQGLRLSDLRPSTFSYYKPHYKPCKSYKMYYKQKKY